MGVRDLIRSPLWYNSVGGDQIEIWWVVETGSEVNCGTYNNQGGARIETRWLPTVYILRVASNEKILKKHWMKKRQVDWQWSCIWALTSAVQRSGSSGRQRQTFNKWTHDVCHDSSESVFNTYCNGMRHISKANGARERWIFIIESLHWCATYQLLLQ